MIQIICGCGKGKTSAATGGAIRAYGRGREVIFSQFMKSGETGEVEFLKNNTDISVLRSEKEFGFFNTLTEIQKEELKIIHNGILEEVIRKIENSTKDIFIVLDEIGCTIEFGLVDESLIYKLISIVKADEYRIELIMTGRNFEEKWKLKADYISCIDNEKHVYDKGVIARLGIEY